MLVKAFQSIHFSIVCDVLKTDIVKQPVNKCKRNTKCKKVQTKTHFNNVKKGENLNLFCVNKFISHINNTTRVRVVVKTKYFSRFTLRLVINTTHSDPH